MADNRSSQAIQSIVTSNSVKVSKDINDNTTANPIHADISDGVNALTLSVFNSALSGTNTSIPIAGRYQVTPDTFDDGDATHFLTDANGRLKVIFDDNALLTDDSAFSVGVDKVQVGGFLADETTPDSIDEGDVGAARITLDRKQLMVIADPTTDANRLAIDASGFATINVNGIVPVSATDLDIRDLTSLTDSVEVLQSTHDNLNANANLQINDVDVSPANPVPISKDQNINSSTNPIFVNVVEGGLSATEIDDFYTLVDVPVNATATHAYPVTATKTFVLDRVMASCAQPIRVEVKVGPIATQSTVAVKFTSGANRNVDFDFNGKIEVPDTASGTISVEIKNIGDQQSDVYSTILGNEI